MKKFAVLVATVALFAVAAPVFAATNPFMDVPMNSWAYDAVASLAAKGILSGYPDGLYKGKQAMTRFEAASAVARALAYVDMTKADKQDVEMLKRLVVEFKDELDALGVRVDALEKDFGVMKKRLGGWRFSGHLRTDVDYRTRDTTMLDVPTPDKSSQFGVWQNRMRLFIERWFGENEEMYFYARINATTAGHDNNTNADQGDQGLNWRRFFVRMPIFADMQLTVGRFVWNMENTTGDYIADPTGRYGVTTGWFSDYEAYGLGVSKEFGMGRFRMTLTQGHGAMRPVGSGTNNAPTSAFAVTANVDFNFTEKFKANLGGQYLKNNEKTNGLMDNTYNWSAVTTGWLGLQADIVEGLRLAGSVYFQSVGTNNVWVGDSGGTAFRADLIIGQEILKFSNLYFQYAKFADGFYMREPASLMVTTDDWAAGVNLQQGGFMDDVKIFRIGAVQKWNDKWSTWLFWERATLSDVDATANGFGGGVVYYYKPGVNFALNYSTLRGDGNAEAAPARIRFTTEVTF